MHDGTWLVTVHGHDVNLYQCHPLRSIESTLDCSSVTAILEPLQRAKYVMVIQTISPYHWQKQEKGNSKVSEDIPSLLSWICNRKFKIVVLYFNG